MPPTAAMVPLPPFHFSPFTFHEGEIVDLLKNALVWCRDF